MAVSVRCIWSCPKRSLDSALARVIPGARPMCQDQRATRRPHHRAGADRAWCELKGGAADVAAYLAALGERDILIRRWQLFMETTPSSSCPPAQRWRCRPTSTRKEWTALHARSTRCVFSWCCPCSGCQYWPCRSACTSVCRWVCRSFHAAFAKTSASTLAQSSKRMRGRVCRLIRGSEGGDRGWPEERGIRRVRGGETVT